MLGSRSFSHLRRTVNQWLHHHSFSLAGLGFNPGKAPLNPLAIPASAFRPGPSATLHRPSYGVRTPAPASDRQGALARCPFQFETGYAGCSLGPSRPLPPPFSALPSTSFSDPLTNSWSNLDARPGQRQLVRGITNGDDAVLAARNYIGVNDGVGGWKGKPLGHAALWSRLMLHFWAYEVEQSINRLEKKPGFEPDTVECLQQAYRETLRSTTMPACNWKGSTTSVTALLYRAPCPENPSKSRPMLYVTNVGDSQLLVIRPSTQKIIFRTATQYHAIDCPLQLGTNSPDTPRNNAAANKVALEEQDIVIAVSDGVVDNLWKHEILGITLDALKQYNDKILSSATPSIAARMRRAGGPMTWIARRIVDAARTVAYDPMAESPYMEKAMDRGVMIRGGKEDDISVVVGCCRQRVLGNGIEG